MTTDWGNLTYLARGNAKQQAIYRLIREHRLLEPLREYDPVLVGTFPIDIDVPGSDLDIICCVADFDRFEAEMRAAFAHYPEWVCKRKVVDGVVRAKGGFVCDGWAVEVFGQAVPTREQNGYKHMVVEDRLLRLFGEELRRGIRELKERGIKTEPAFARLLQLIGEPYRGLLELYGLGDAEMRQAVVMGMDVNAAANVDANADAGGTSGGAG